MPESINKYMIIPPRFITDSAGNFWSLIPSKNGMQIAVNGIVDSTTALVTLIYYKNHRIYQQNSRGGWWCKDKISDPWMTTADPRIP